jgi:23S rRNA pseudouridine2605 synthase
MAVVRTQRKTRASGDKKAPRSSAGKRGPRISADKQGPRASSGKRGPRISADKKGSAVSADKKSGRTGENNRTRSVADNKRTRVISRKNSGRKLPASKHEGKELLKTGHESDLIRLNKYLASTGVCSRREADEFITAGLVSVNGKLVTELGMKISPGDVVKYNGETLREERKVYIVLNKPKDYVTTVEDPHAKKTVLDLVKGACKERIYPVGRLDRNTTGVLLLTNDGELTKRLTHPKFEKLKIYHVFLNKNIRPADMEKISTGVNLEDGLIKADNVSYADPVDKTQVGIEIHSGRNHIVRRIFEHLGYEVVKLDRVYFAGLTKKNLHRGEWRFLNEKEISMLKMNAYK